MTKKNESFRILIVDDNREIRTILEESCEKRDMLPKERGKGARRSRNTANPPLISLSLTSTCRE